MEVSQNDRIAQDAREYCKGVGNSFKAHVMTNAYVAGAMAERDRAKVLVDALEFVKNNGLCSETTEVINKALEQWEGKEVKPEHYVSIGEHITYCQDCGFPLLPIDECNCDDI
jgi:hypothetical protein